MERTAKTKMSCENQNRNGKREARWPDAIDGAKGLVIRIMRTTNHDCTLTNAIKNNLLSAIHKPRDPNKQHSTRFTKEVRMQQQTFENPALGHWSASTNLLQDDTVVFASAPNRWKPRIIVGQGFAIVIVPITTAHAVLPIIAAAVCVSA